MGAQVGVNAAASQGTLQIAGSYQKLTEAGRTSGESMPRRCLDLGLLASRTVRGYMSLSLWY